MIHKEYTWKGNDGIRLYGQSWMPDHPPAVIINYVHGFKDHSNRFEKWATRFVDHGYGVIAIDLRGHGRSEGRRGFAPAYNSYLTDIAVLLKNSQELFGSTAYHILYGHSLGGNLVVNFLITQKKLPHAAIITSPWFTLAVKPSWFHMAAARIIRYTLPQMLVKSNLDARYLSRDAAVVEQYRRDPLVHNLIRPKLFLEIEQRGIKASRSIYKINLPLLVMHGTGDRITSFRQTKSFVMNAGKLTTFKEWPDASHELHNDLPEKEVFNYLLHWIRNLTVKS
jgi:alpha-beta hydrolase superfamily lysophospholipase